MKVEHTNRGFGLVKHIDYGVEVTSHSRLIQESSAIGDSPHRECGSSFLWVGEHHHLNRDEVRELTGLMIRWLATGGFK